MIVAGCDVGSLSSKVVIIKDEEILAYHVIRSKNDPVESADLVMAEALKKAGITMDSIEFCVGTGYGRNSIPFADEVESEIACHGIGAQWLAPSVRTIIDIGGQDAKAMRLDDKGNVARYVYNDKCASGTGRFLEVMADALGVGLEDMGDVSFQSKKPVTISNQCVVFAETEVISLVNDGKPIPDIVAGLHKAMAHRVASLAKAIGIENDIAFTGGVAKNPGMFKALEQALGSDIKNLDIDPQIMGALGAGIIAARKCENRQVGLHGTV